MGEWERRAPGPPSPILPLSHSPNQRPSPAPALIGLLAGLALAGSLPAALAQQPSRAGILPPAGGAPPLTDDGTRQRTLVNSLLIGLVVVMVGAKFGGELAERSGQPAVLGEILAGIALGNLGYPRRA